MGVSVSVYVYVGTYQVPGICGVGVGDGVKRDALTAVGVPE